MQIDLDANASTRSDPAVLSKMEEVAKIIWGNPSSLNWLGEAARQEVEEARLRIAQLIGASAGEIFFTSGATESINLALQGFFRARGLRRPLHVVTTNVEHKAVLETLGYITSRGVEVTCLGADRLGRIHPEQVRLALREETALVCLIHGNNEIGTINEVECVGRIVKENSRALLFVDAAQTGAYCPPSAAACQIDLMALSAHKMYGPKGAGALFAREGVALAPLMFGGGQERGLRSGTLNTVAIAGFGVAAGVAATEGGARSARLAEQRQRFVRAFLESVSGARLNGDPENRVPGNISLTIPYVESANIIRRLPHLALSQSSACVSRIQQPSHVLRAIGLTIPETHWTIRIGLSWHTTDEELELAVSDLTRVCLQMRRG